MKNKKYTLLTTALFLIIIGLGYYITPLIVHFSDPTSILNTENEVTNDYIMASNSVTNRVFEPLKRQTMGISLTDDEIKEIQDTASYFNITEADLPWLFSENTAFFRPEEMDSYTYSTECIAIVQSGDTFVTFVFDPYIFYVLESVKRPSTDPTPAQIAAAYDKLNFDSNITSEKLISYLELITVISDVDSYEGTSYLSNSLYYSMYMNSVDTEYDNTFSAYNYTLSYNLYDCVLLGEKTIQFDGSMFAITYFVDQYGIILYYDPILQEFCGYTILDN